MALPDSGGKFPTAPFDEAQKDFQIWNAWYVGATQDLEAVYAGGNMVRPSQMSNGLIGKVARFFWGRPNLQSSSKLHVPAAADLARSSADLLFSQPPKFTLTDADAKNEYAKTRLDLLFNSDETAATYLESAEICSALGGTYMRLWWDERIADHVMLGSVAADAAIPSWTYNQLSAVTFWTTVLDDNGIVLRHLERHERGRILHGLYQGDSGHLGRKVPLGEVESTEWAAGIVDADGGIETGVDSLTASYVPNVRPNRRWRTKPGLTQLGRSDFDGLEPLFDALDEAYSSWMRDLDLGKARLFVSEELLINNGPGKGSAFDSDQAIFTPLKEQMAMSAAGGAGPGVQANQFTIRWQEHSQTCAELLNAILRGAGLSSNNFSDSSLTVGVPTATEVNSKDKLSERTRDKKINYWKSGLRPLAKTAMDIDYNLFDGVQLSEIPELNFPTRSTQSPAEMSASIAALRAANAISIEQSVKERNPNWSSEDQTEEVDRIKAELAEANSFGGGFGDPQSDEVLDAA